MNKAGKKGIKQILYPVGESNRYITELITIPGYYQRLFSEKFIGVTFVTQNHIVF